MSEVFYFAQNAVLHPTAPLYDTREHVSPSPTPFCRRGRATPLTTPLTTPPPTQTLKPACIAALSRIFKLCDVNKDGLLDDDELNDFQRVCFDAPLQARELAGVKEVVAQLAGEGREGEGEGEGIVEGALTEQGFLWLHTYFIQKGRLETTWKALRTFGYGEDLSLREDWLYPR